MSGIFSTFNTANRGLQASQINVDTTSHNIANANTEGYSRQRVGLETSYPFNKPGIGQIGTGVDIALITRVRDEYLDTQIRSEKSIGGEYSAKLEVLGQVESLFMEPGDSGLSAVMGKMWNAWQELSKNPESSTLKNIVSQASQTFTNTVKQIDKGLESLKSNISDIVDNKISSIESIVKKIDGLNDQISKFHGTKQKPNDLMDRRDLLLDNLSEIVEIETSKGSNGKIEVKVNNEILTNSVNSIKDTINSILDGDLADNGTYDLFHGEIIGYKRAGQEIDYVKNSLNDLVEGMANAINTIHLDGGVPFFTSDGGVPINAGNITVNSQIVNDPDNINSGSVGIEDPKSLQIAMLTNNSQSVGGVNSTFDNYYRNIVSKVGVATSEAKSMAESQESLLQQLNVRKESVSGVSMDEEIANLVKYQHSYQANSKVISTLTDMLDTIINRMGV